MGSTWTIVLYGGSENKAAAEIRAAFDELRRIEGLLSIHSPESEVSRLNRLAASAPVEVSRELFSLLLRCGDYFRRSEGAFDITIGALMKTWGLRGRPGRIPAEEDREEALSRTGFGNIQMDSASMTVRFLRTGIEIDTGGIGKGYAVDRIAVLLREAGFGTALIAASRSTILGLGTPPTSRTGWPVDVMHPGSRGRPVTEVFLRDIAISTSGSLEKGFVAGGQRHSHLFNPGTGLPAPGSPQVSVLGPGATDTEAWTKPCLLRGREWAARHLPPNLSALFCEEDGSCSRVPSSGPVDCPDLRT